MKHSGDDRFTYNGEETLFDLQDFWEYYASDILNSRVRGAIAEFIVNKALNVNIFMKGWQPFDIIYGAYRLEVKSSGYVHNTTTNRLSRPVFNISKHQVFLDETKWTQPKRNSDYYIFALFACKDVRQADTMKLEQWEFYIVPTSYLNENYDNSKTISLSVVQSIGKKATYDTLRDTLNDLILSIEGDAACSAKNTDEPEEGDDE